MPEGEFMKRIISIYFLFIIIFFILPNNSHSAVFSYDEKTEKIYIIEETADGVSKREITLIEFAQEVGKYPQMEQSELLMGGQSHSKNFSFYSDSVADSNYKKSTLTLNPPLKISFERINAKIKMTEANLEKLEKTDRFSKEATSLRENLKELKRLEIKMEPGKTKIK
jgi:hypothetical protein